MINDESTFFRRSGAKLPDAACFPAMLPAASRENTLIAAAAEVGSGSSCCCETGGGGVGGGGEGYQRSAASQGIKDVTQTSEI